METSPLSTCQLLVIENGHLKCRLKEANSPKAVPMKRQRSEADSMTFHNLPKKLKKTCITRCSYKAKTSEHLFSRRFYRKRFTAFYHNHVRSDVVSYPSYIVPGHASLAVNQHLVHTLLPVTDNLGKGDQQ